MIIFWKWYKLVHKCIMYFLLIDACHRITPLRIINLTFIFKVKNLCFFCICNTNCTTTAIVPVRFVSRLTRDPPPPARHRIAHANCAFNVFFLFLQETHFPSGKWRLRCAATSTDVGNFCRTRVPGMSSVNNSRFRRTVFEKN